jgi:hypothetical protein
MENLVIREAQNVVPLRVQYSVPRSVACDFRIGRMRGAIDFDDEARVEADEVCNKAFEDDLTSKPEASDLFASDAIPETAFGACRIRPELAGNRL